MFPFRVPTNFSATFWAGAWRPDGLIIFPGIAEGLYQVSANGGTPAPATLLDAARGEEAQGWPVFIRDRRQFVFSILSSRRENSGVFVGAANSAERRPLVDALSNSVFAEPGYLLYMRGGILVAQRFDADRLEMMGEPVALVEGVVHNLASGKGAFTGSNTGVLAYRRVDNSELDLVDRRGQLIRMLGEPAPYHDPALSPGGTRLAVARLDATTGMSNIWLIDATRGVSTRLTSPPSDDGAPVWSPDGGEIVFQSLREDVVSVRRRASNPGDPDEVLYSSPYLMTPTAWSFGGQAVLCDAFVPKAGEGQVSVLDLSGPTPVKAHPWATGKQGRLSADGRWVAFVSTESGTDEVYVRPFPSGATKWRLSTAGGIEPAWRGDGREIFYLAPDGAMMAVEVNLGPKVTIAPPHRLFATRLSGNNARNTVRNQYDVSDDGQRFVLNDPVAPTPITVIINWTSLLSR